MWFRRRSVITVRYGCNGNSWPKISTSCCALIYMYIVCLNNSILRRKQTWPFTQFIFLSVRDCVMMSSDVVACAQLLFLKKMDFFPRKSILMYSRQAWYKYCRRHRLLLSCIVQDGSNVKLNNLLFHTNMNMNMN